MEVLAEGQLVECITIPQEEYKQLTAERDRYKEDAERLANMLDTETREHLAFSVQVGERIADLTRQNEALSQEAK